VFFSEHALADQLVVRRSVAIPAASTALPMVHLTVRCLSGAPTGHHARHVSRAGGCVPNAHEGCVTSRTYMWLSRSPAGRRMIAHFIVFAGEGGV
jgi:hypothetical protein